MRLRDYKRDPELLAAEILGGDRAALARGITLIEGRHFEQRAGARRLLEAVLPHMAAGKKGLRVGISGVPGAGKSTLVEGLGQYLAGTLQRKVAVLAIDPSSQLAGGSVLGDKTRMQKLSQHANAFIRPTPSLGQYGGVGEATFETLLLCEAAGYDIVFIETVGVGQSEVLMSQMVDIFVTVVLPGAGDELQGIKRGIVEFTHIFFMNKTDQFAETLIDSTQIDLGGAASLSGRSKLRPPPEFLRGSALRGQGIIELWNCIEGWIAAAQRDGRWAEVRSVQQAQWAKRLAHSRLEEVYRLQLQGRPARELLEQVSEGMMTPLQAADRLFEQFKMEMGCQGAFPGGIPLKPER